MLEHGQIWQRMMERGTSPSRMGRARLAMTRMMMLAMKRREMTCGSSFRAEKSSSSSRYCAEGGGSVLYAGANATEQEQLDQFFNANAYNAKSSNPRRATLMQRLPCVLISMLEVINRALLSA